jgi:murein DD-endopeptidase MepM/ murein hydrolase activator NlpD
MTIFRSRAIACFALLLLCLSSASGQQAATSSKAWSVTWQPKKLVNGSAVLFRVTPRTQLETLSGTWLGHTIDFRFDPVLKTWYGLGGASLSTEAGSHPLALQGTTPSGKFISYEESVRVDRARYPKIAIQVPKKFTEPSAEQLRTIAQDKSVKDSVFAKVTPLPEWAGDFHAPVQAKISDVFGTARTINGKVQSVHQGLDYAVPSGTPVAALNRGTVLLARPLYFEGNCVVLDHGQGLLTLYLHFSEIAVKEGDIVQRGQVLGLSGGTGRATGPHLHIAVRWQGVYLDPATLLRLQTPKEFAVPAAASEPGRVPRKD